MLRLMIRAHRFLFALPCGHNIGLRNLPLRPENKSFCKGNCVLYMSSVYLRRREQMHVFNKNTSSKGELPFCVLF